MADKKEKLGKGIRALLGSITEEEQGHSQAETTLQPVGTSEIALDQIEVNPFQPRADFNPENLQELSESIKVHGVIQPITVRRLGGEKYQLIAGERRLRASRIAGLQKVPVYIREADDQEMLEIALIENIQRENLNAIEISINYRRLMEECSLTQEALAARLGKNRTTVTNYLRLLKLPPEIQHGIKTQKISMGHARALINLEDPAIQLDIYRETIKKDHSVRKVEALVRAVQEKAGNAKNSKKSSLKALPFAYQKIQDDLSSLLGVKVAIHQKDGERGEIVIPYQSDEDLNRILEQIEK